MVSPSTIKLLRLPFSIFLSPIYLFALSLLPAINWSDALLVFIILHFLVYPASNGYNSFMDRDTGSIGGLEKPPLPSSELYIITIVLDCCAIALSFMISPWYALMILLYIGASKAYSYRGIRLKKYPFIGYLTVIIFQGAFTCWLVYTGAGAGGPHPVPWQGMLICALLIGGFYPLTQIYQHQQDKEDDVITISYVLGYHGTFYFSGLLYIIVWVVMAQFFISNNQLTKFLVTSIFFIPIIVYFIAWFLRVKKNKMAADFKNTMRMNWLAATCTNIAFFILLIWRWFE